MCKYLSYFHSIGSSKKLKLKESGYGIVGRPVTSSTRYPRFKSGHGQILFHLNCIEMMKIKEKDTGN